MYNKENLFDRLIEKYNITNSTGLLMKTNDKKIYVSLATPFNCIAIEFLDDNFVFENNTKIGIEDLNKFIDSDPNSYKLNYDAPTIFIHLFNNENPNKIDILAENVSLEMNSSEDYFNYDLNYDIQNIQTEEDLDKFIEHILNITIPEIMKIDFETNHSN
jgi:hypothetical protein